MGEARELSHAFAQSLCYRNEIHDDDDDDDDAQGSTVGSARLTYARIAYSIECTYARIECIELTPG